MTDKPSDIHPITTKLLGKEMYLWPRKSARQRGLFVVSMPKRRPAVVMQLGVPLGPLANFSLKKYNEQYDINLSDRH